MRMLDLTLTPENCIGLYDLLLKEKDNGRIIMLRKGKSGLEEQAVTLPAANSEAEKLEAAMQIAAYIFGMMHEGWKIGIREGVEVEYIDVSQFYSAALSKPGK